METGGTEMGTLKVKDLCKTYILNKCQNHVLRNINLEIKEGKWLRLWVPRVLENQRFYIP